MVGSAPGAGSIGRVGPPPLDRPARILVLTGLYPTRDRPGLGPFVRRRVEALAARGVDVRVVAPRDRGRSVALRLLDLLVRGLTLRPGFDGVEGHVLYPDGLVALLVARLRRRPLLIYAHGADVREAATRNRAHRRLARLVARSADAVVTNSAATAELVAGLGRRAEVIPPGVDLERFRPASSAECRTALGLPNEGLLALYVGTLSRRKGADVFAEGIAGSPGWLGVMVGDGDLMPVLRSEHPNLHLVGPVAPDAVPDWIDAADVVVVPSREEPLGLAAVEALACGVPVVASATGGLREIVRDDVSGFLVPPDDPGALAAALGRFQDPGLRGRLAGAARESVAAHDIRVTSEAMAAVWRTLGVSA